MLAFFYLRTWTTSMPSIVRVAILELVSNLKSKLVSSTVVISPMILVGPISPFGRSDSVYLIATFLSVSSLRIFLFSSFDNPRKFSICLLLKICFLLAIVIIYFFFYISTANTKQMFLIKFYWHFVLYFYNYHWTMN